MFITIDQFLNRQERKNTRVNYQTSLKQFFESLQVDPSKYFCDDRNFEQDLFDFKAWLKAKGKSSKTIESRIGAVFSFLLANKVIGHDLWKQLKLDNGTTTQDRIPTHDELRSILSHMDSRGRALCLVLVSSGMRIGDALKMTIDRPLPTQPVLYEFNSLL